MTDTPCVEFAHELIEAYPEAKVVLTNRDIDSRYESYMATVGGDFVYYHQRYLNPWSIWGYLMPRWAVGDQCCQETTPPTPTPTLIIQGGVSASGDASGITIFS